ncbi:hypothetical protein ACFCW2_08635 [Qipengyuania sp. DSG2-2]|uniref:hypothetical protein n=1 Tax=Qipengyuania sp. DGS2-2 TaxID=3349631 RepID=UPI0036D21AE7
MSNVFSGGLSGLAILWLAYATHVQRRELAINSNALQAALTENFVKELVSSLELDASYIVSIYIKKTKDKFRIGNNLPNLHFIVSSFDFRSWLEGVDFEQNQAMAMTIQDMKDRLARYESILKKHKKKYKYNLDSPDLTLAYGAIGLLDVLTKSKFERLFNFGDSRIS